jgi:hypothetical protein
MNAIRLRTLFIISALLLKSSFAFGQSPTSFTYQGRLNLNGSPATGSYDMEFILLDGAYNPLIFSAVDPVGVTNGLFTVMLDYGTAFDGSQRYLRIGVRPHGNTNFYTFLSPPQTLTAAPYAIYAENVGPNASVPPGSIMAYMGTNPPSGWLLCDGSAVSRTVYSRLFGVIGVSNGYGDGTGLGFWPLAARRSFPVGGRYGLCRARVGCLVFKAVGFDYRAYFHGATTHHHQLQAIFLAVLYWRSVWCRYRSRLFVAGFSHRLIFLVRSAL